MARHDCNAKFRHKLRSELAVTNKAFEAHIKEFNCKIDWSGCTDRAKFQERIQVLEELLEWSRARRRLRRETECQKKK